LERIHTPKEEIENLIDTVRKVRILADRYHVKLSFITDYLLLEKYGEQIAPLVDMFGIQMQRYQREKIDVFRKEVLKKVFIIRRGSKTVPIIIQISLVPPKREERVMLDGTKKKVLLRDEKGHKIYVPIPQEVILQQIQAVKDIVDGIAFLYNEETREDLRQLIFQLRR
jgi:hypothetical protein